MAQQARGQIEAGGTLKQENTWGLRKMAYEINHRTEADYRWFRFEAPTELLGQLDHNLKIADGVLRFRIFKVDPGAAGRSRPPARIGAVPGRGTRRAAAHGGRERAAAERPASSAPSAPPALSVNPPAGGESRRVRA